MDIKARPVMNVMLTGMGLIPFHRVEVTIDGITKRILVNYTFGTVISAEGMNERLLEYENDLGRIKERLFNALQPTKFVQVAFLAPSEYSGTIEDQIKLSLKSAQDGDRILFVWERKGNTDSPFYNALGLAKDGVVIQPVPDPLSLSELGLKVGPPFMEVPMSLLGKGAKEKGRRK